MGILDKFRKRGNDDKPGIDQQTPIEEEGAATSSDNDDTAPGWDAITASFEATYPGQTNPAHYGTILKYWMGGNDPIDGISVYRASDPIPHWHYITYGYSDLYGQNLTDDPNAESGYGIEMTFRLADDAAADPDATPPVWVMNMLQNLARYVFTTGNVILPNHHLDANSPIALDTDTQLTALVFTEDPIGSPIDTPSGKVKLVQAVGITGDELEHCVQWNVAGVLDVLGKRWPHGITVLDRQGLDSDPELVAEVETGIERDGSSMGSCFIETLVIEEIGDEVSLTVSSYVGDTLGRSAASRLPYGRVLTVMGKDAVLLLEPEEDEVIRETSEEMDSISISLTPEGVEALGTLPSEPGEYRLPEIPGVVWKLIKTD